MNQVQLLGELVSSVEVNRVGGRAWAKTIVAVTREGEPGVDFVPVTLHDREAIDAAKYLGDGSKVSIKGHLHSALGTERGIHGRRRNRRVLHVIADRVTYLVICPPRGGRPA